MGKPFELEADPWRGEAEFGANLGEFTSERERLRLEQEVRGLFADGHGRSNNTSFARASALLSGMRRERPGINAELPDLPRVDPQRVRARALQIAQEGLPGFRIDQRGPGGHLLPASFGNVWPRISGALQAIQDPNNALFVLTCFKWLTDTPGGREHLDPFLTVAIAARENGATPFRRSNDATFYHTYYAGGLDVIGSAISSGRLTSHHAPASHLQRWRTYLRGHNTAISIGTRRPQPLVTRNERGNPIHAAGLQKRDFLTAYGSFLIFRWDDQGTLRRNEQGYAVGSLSLLGTVEFFGFDRAQIAALTPLARRIWHALFFGGPGGASFGSRGGFGARTILSFLQSRHHGLEDITRLAVLPGARSLVEQRRTRAAFSVALAAEAMDREAAALSGRS